jgi:hypothetical protein
MTDRLLHMGHARTVGKTHLVELTSTRRNPRLVALCGVALRSLVTPFGEDGPPIPYSAHWENGATTGERSICVNCLGKV